jgi:ribosomal protein S18 acetylase RimI-like enzyme
MLLADFEASRPLYHPGPMTKLRVDGHWPGQVVLRRGWARAESRPWNDATPMAHLRMVRGGGTSFIGDCVETLADLGSDAVLSPPLPASAQTAWREAGFESCCDLTLMRRSLDHVPPPGRLVMTGVESDIPEALRIDAAAFDEFWRFDQWALTEAMQATPTAIIHVVRAGDGGLAGFSVTGAGSTISYVQRLAVDPDWQGQGIGRSLVRASARWAKRAGSRTLMLNTQADNEAAIGLYRAEGFELLEEPLAVLSTAA